MTKKGVENRGNLKQRGNASWPHRGWTLLPEACATVYQNASRALKSQCATAQVHFSFREPPSSLLKT